MSRLSRKGMALVLGGALLSTLMPANNAAASPRLHDIETTQALSVSELCAVQPLLRDVSAARLLGLSEGPRAFGLKGIALKPMRKRAQQSHKTEKEKRLRIVTLMPSVGRGHYTDLGKGHQKGHFRVTDQWIPALTLIWDAVLTPSARFRKLVQRYAVVFYYNAETLSAFEIWKDKHLTRFMRRYRKFAKGWKKHRFVPVFTFDHRAFKAPAVLALLAVPHETRHARLLHVDVPDALQEVFAHYQDGLKLLQVALAPTEPDVQLVVQVAELLGVGGPSSPYTAARLRRPRALIEQIKTELEHLERHDHHPRSTQARVDPKAWGTEHSLHTFLRDMLRLLDVQRTLTPREVLDGVTAFMRNNEKRFAKETAYLNKTDPADLWRQLRALDRLTRPLFREAA